MARPRLDDKRERILDAAVIEIAGQGYHQTTVAMIAGRAGVADGTIYLYFRSKEEILVGLFDRAMAQFIAEGRQLPQAGDAAQRLRELITLHLNLLGRDRDLAIVFQVELRHSLHFLDLFSRTRLREYFEAIAGIIAQGQREGTFRADLEPLFMAKAIFGILDETATDWVLAKRNTRLAARADEIGDLLLRGLGAG